MNHTSTDNDPRETFPRQRLSTENGKPTLPPQQDKDRRDS